MLYNFCPGKATWDIGLANTFQQLLIISELKQFPNGKPLNDQDDWFADLVAWFLPAYDLMKFVKKADMILGSSKEIPSKIKAPSRGR